MEQTFSIDHVAAIYDVSPRRIKQWTIRKYGFAKKEIHINENGKVAKFVKQRPQTLRRKVDIAANNLKFEELRKKRIQLKQELKKQQIIQKINQEKPVKINIEGVWRNIFQTLKSYKYKESAQSIVDEQIASYGENLKIRIKICELYNQLPSAKEFIDLYCKKEYFTWHDLIFVENGLKVDPNKFFLSIPIDGPTKILQNLQIEYFQKKYKDELYKIYINSKTGKAELSLSKDINRIKSIVENHIHSVKKERYTNNSKSLNNSSSSLSHTSDSSRLISIQDIIKDFHHNQYIQIVAKLIRKNGKALALWENNNGIQEESLLIILRHTFSYVIWENINDKRACYIFKFKSGNFEQNLNRLKNFITSEIHNKRESLFRHADIREHKIIVEDYRSIIHENPMSYKEAINNFIYPHFKL